MSIGLTKEELKSRNNDSLIKYIGVLQAELALIYAGKLPPSGVEIAAALDSTGTHELKCKP